MAFTVHDMVRLRKDMERDGHSDADIRAEIKIRCGKSVRSPKPASVAKPAVRTRTVSPVALGPAARADRMVIAVSASPRMCDMCADVHAPGDHIL